MRKIGKKMLIPLIIALALVLGGAMGAFGLTSSGLPFESKDYKAQFYLNHLQVHLLENGKDVCGGKNTLDGESKVSGDLMKDLGYSRAENTDGKEVLGSVEPGKVYAEKIQAKNGQDVPVYVRVTIRKFWMKEVKGNDGSTELVKATDLSPNMIRLKYGSEAYNKGGWFINENESTAEQTTYYYKHQVASEDVTEPLFNNLSIDTTVMKRTELPPVVNNKTGVATIKYQYDYDGYAFFIKADVQAIQTHNANDAIHSQWGVYDIVEEDGTLSLK